MGNLIRLACDVHLDPDAFERNDDGSWTVLEDTKVYSDATSRANTLLLPSGAVIEAQMFRANDLDLMDILEETSSHAKAV